jgi:hypothetical protein
MSTLLALLGFMALSVAGLVLAPTNRALVQASLTLVMGATVVWLITFWIMALTLLWPAVVDLLHTTPLIIQVLQLLTR